METFQSEINCTEPKATIWVSSGVGRIKRKKKGETVGRFFKHPRRAKSQYIHTRHLSTLTREIKRRKTGFNYAMAFMWRMKMLGTWDRFFVF